MGQAPGHSRASWTGQHPNQVKEEWEPRLDRYCLISRRKVVLNMEKINEVKSQKESEKG